MGRNLRLPRRWDFFWCCTNTRKIRALIYDSALGHLSIIRKPQWFPCCIILFTYQSYSICQVRSALMFSAQWPPSLFNTCQFHPHSVPSLPSFKKNFYKYMLTSGQAVSDPSDSSGTGQSSQGKFSVRKQSIDPEIQHSSCLIPAVLCNKSCLKMMQASPSNVWALPSTSSLHSIKSALLLQAVASPNPC